MRASTVTRTPRGSLAGRLTVSVVAAVIAAIVAATFTPMAAYADDSGTISGSVTGSDWEGLGGVAVKLYDYNTDFVAATTTNSAGSWAFGPVDDGYYKLSFEKSGYAKQWWGGGASPDFAELIASFNDGVADIDAHLEVGATVGGTVTDSSTGLPLAGVTVYVYDNYNECTSEFDAVANTHCASTTTDSLGQYSFDTLSGGRYQLLFSAEGYVNVYNGGGILRWGTPVINVGWGEQSNANNIALAIEGTISGTVNDLNGDPVEGANVNVTSTAGVYINYTTTDASGDYTVGDLLPGTYKVQVYADGYLPAFWNGSRLGNSTHIALTTGQHRTGVSFELDRGASVAGTITAAGEPIAGLEVYVLDTRHQYVGSATTDENGRYGISGLEGGSFTVQGYYGDTTVCVVPTWFGGSTDSELATYFSIPAHALAVNKNIAMVGCGTISGSVTSAGTPAVPIAGAWVNAYAVDGSYGGQAQVASNGHYDLTGLAPNSYKLEVTTTNIGSIYADKWYGGTAVASTAVATAIAAGGSVTRNFALGVGGTISGNVKEAPSTNLEYATVTAHGQNTGKTYFASTDASGNYSMKGLAADTYKLSFSGSYLASIWWSNATSEASATGIVVALGSTITAKNAILTSGATISGRVVSAATGEGLESIGVTAYSSSGEELRWAYSDEDGNYTMYGVRPGSVTLKFSEYYGQWQPLWWNNKASFSVANGLTYTGKNASLVGTSSISGHVTDPLGDDVDSVLVGAFQISGSSYELTQSVISDGDGNYTIPGLTAGSYRLGFSDYGTGASFEFSEGIHFQPEFFNNRTSVSTADAITVPTSSQVTGKDVQLAYVGSLLTLTAAPVPSIAGAAVPGQTLSVVPGTWGPAPVALTYQWQRDGVPVEGKTASVYPVTAADLGFAISVAVTGTKSGYTTETKLSLSTAVVAGVLVAPVPTITGTGAVGQLLTAVPGTWGPATVDLAYQWNRDGAAIEDATSATYLLTSDDAGKTITVTVTGTKANYATQSKTSVGKAVGSVLTTATPTFTGIPTVGKPLTAVAGAWGPAPVSLSYQWNRAGTPISGALSSVYLATAADAGKALSVTVTGTKAGYTTVSLTSGSVIIGNAFTATPIPTISGTPTAGTELTASVGLWSPAPVTLAYQWLRNGSPIAGETGTTYTPTTADAASSITFAVTGTKLGFTPMTTTSAAKVIGLPLSDVGTPTISGQNTVGQLLSADPGLWGPTPITFAYQWNRAGVAIAGATGATYTPVAADGGKQLTVTVTGSKATYFAVAATSAPLLVNFALTTAAPTVTGTPTVGQRLTAVAGTWGPAPVVLAYQWYRDGTPIAGATASSYLLTGADSDTVVSVGVTGVKAGYTVVSRSNEGSLIGVALGTPPVPTITGVPAIGSTLSAVAGTWTPAPVDLTYQWKRAGVVIAGATASDYTLVAADLGKAITVTVTGSKPGYTAASSTSAAVTAASALTATPVPTVTGVPAVGSTLTAVAGTWTPAPVTLSYKWLRNGVAITGATAATYKLVTADAGQLVTVAVTGAKTGYASIAQTSTGTLVQSLLTPATPTITGTATVNETLTVQTGTWTPSPDSLNIQWNRAGVPIVGATGPSYLLVAADAGKAITVTVTGFKEGYTTASATSAAKTINNVLNAAPVPTVTGTPAVGSTLTAAAGTWAPAPVTLTYAWLRNGVAIPGATLATYKLVTADAGQAITVAVTGAKAGYASVMQASADTVVQSLLSAATPVITGVPTVGETLTVNAGAWGPDPVDLTYQWKRAGAVIAGATAEEYTLVTADLAKAITVTVTGTKAGYATTSTTSAASTIGTALTATPTPTITGTAAVGSTLTAVASTWTPAPVTLAYKWLRNGVAITGATASTYKLVAADAGQLITVTVTGAKSGFTTVATTSASLLIESLLTAPVPTISGNATVFDTLTAVVGAWGPAPVDLTYQWKRAGAVIEGATGQDYQLGNDDIGKLVTVTVTGTKEGYTTASATSAAKTVNNLLTDPPTPTITGTPMVGSTLTATTSAWAPAPVVLSYKWLRNGTAITGATASTYKLVTADAGQLITLVVTGTKAGYAAASRYSSDLLIQSLLTAPVPTLSGTGTVDDTLTAVTGAWGPDPVDLTFQWKRAGVPISGATGQDYQLVNADIGKAITVTVTGTKEGYTPASTTSAAKTVNAKLIATPVPTIAGTLAVGSTLTATAGTWTPAPVVLSYKWLRNDVAITGATAATYKLVTADAGQTITVAVTGTKTGFASVVQTSAGATVQSLLTPVVPTIAGTATVNETLTAVSGSWASEPDLSYQWYRGGVAIAGETSVSYTLQAADGGKAITVTVTGTKSDYTTASATSAAKTITSVLAATPVPTVVGSPVVGSTLTAAAGTWTPAPVVLTYKWLRNGVPIAGATLATYKLVTADAGQNVTVEVTGTKAGYATVVQTSAVVAVQPLLVAAVPTVTGSGTFGEQLTVVPGTWAPELVDLSIQWNKAGVPIAGATFANYSPVEADLGKVITVTVTGTKAGYTTASATSAGKTVTRPLESSPIPTVTGTPAVGSTLTAVAGTWTPAPVTLSYQWQRNGVTISGATLSTYKLVAADAGQTVTVVVTGTKAGYTTVVQPGIGTAIQSLLTAPVPTVTGAAVVGSTVSAVAGSWAPAPVDFSYQWKRAGVVIAGATAADYTLVSADAGQAITVTVTGSKSGYTSATAVSAALVPYAAAPLPTISGGSTIGSVLTATSGTWATAPVTLAYQWNRNGTAISGATAATYTLTSADLGSTITVSVTGSKTGYAALKRTSSDGVFAQYGLIAAPRPSIDGDPFTGSTLMANYGSWGPSAVTLEFQWLADGVPIVGATDFTYVVDVPEGTAITVRVTGSKTNYLTVSKLSPAVLVVANP